MGSRRFHACLLPLLSACVVLGLGMASETASAGQSAQPTPPPSGMAVHIPFSADAIGQYYEQVHDELSERRANGNEWITLGGGTGFLKYRLWPGDHEHSLSAASVRTQSVLPFGVEYAKKVKGTITKLATCGLESPATGAGRLSVSMETRFGYGRSYQLLPSTNIASVEPKGSCLMQERTVDATPLMLQVYRSELQQALPMADQKAKQALSLKAAMVEVWRDLHEPLLLDEAASLWLLVHPEAVGSGAVQPTPTTLTAGFGITAHPAVVRGAKPAVPLRPLPELGDGGAPDGFRVTFDAAIPMEEANQRLREAVAPLFEHLGEIVAPSRGRWHLRLRQRAAIDNAPLHAGVGRQVDPSRPDGAEGAAWRRLLAEAQPALHAHPVNRLRDAQGRPTVNSLWPWGSGQLPRPSAAARAGFRTFWGSDPLLKGLCALNGMVAEPLPARYTTVHGGVLARHEGLAGSLASFDAMGWRDALANLEKDWLAPALAAVTSGALRRLTLVTSGREQAIATTLQHRDLWRFWRKDVALADLPA